MGYPGAHRAPPGSLATSAPLLVRMKGVPIRPVEDRSRPGGDPSGPPSTPAPPTSVARHHRTERLTSVAAWALALAGPVAVTMLDLLPRHPGTTIPALLFLLVAIGAAVLGGRWPGAAGVILAAGLLRYFFTSPVRSWRLDGAEQLVGLFVFAAAGFLLVEVVGGGRRGRTGARHSRDELETRRNIDAASLGRENARLLRESQEAALAHQRSLALLDTALDGSPVGFAFLDQELRYRRINPALAEMHNLPGPDHLGHTVKELFPDVDPGIEASLSSVLRTGKPVVDVEWSATHPDGRVLHLRGSYYPVMTQDGWVVGVGAVVLDVTATRAIQEELRRSRDQLEVILQGVTSGITVQDPTGKVIYANEAAATMSGYPNVDAFLSAPVEEILGRFEMLDEAGKPFDPALLPGRLALQGKVERDVTMRARDRTSGRETWRVVRAAPVLDTEGNVVLAVNVFRDITEQQKSTRDLRFLAEAGRELASSLDYHATLERTASMAVPVLADWCVVDLLAEEGPVNQVAVAHVRPEKADVARDLRSRFPLDVRPAHPINLVMRTGRSILIPEMSEQDLRDMAGGEEGLALIRELEVRSHIVVPLVARGRILGAISLVMGDSGRRYDQADLALAEELARRAAVAIENAGLYRERDYIARTLQQSLLPPKLPEIPGVELAARYRAAGSGNEVGGDFYDVFDTGETWAVVIGDVCGKGAPAAAVTGLVRYTLRAAAMHEDRPSSILSVLNEAILQQRSDQRFATVACARLRLGDDGVRVTVSCGGHPPPVILRANGEVSSVGRPGMLLGAFPEAEVTDDATDLGPGDALILFTDGVTEAHVTSDDLFGRERLEAVVASCAGLAADAIASRIEDAVASFAADGALRDDIALLVVRILPCV